MPKVSVIIPVYGVERFIERCARSLFEQTLDDIEYLFIDDCTPDKSIEILRRVLEDYPHRKKQVRIHRMEKNSGQAAVRKWGMQNATGDYVIHCDTDDWVQRNAYESLYTKALHCSADLIVCDYCITDGINKQIINACHEIDKKSFIKNVLTLKDSGALWNKLVRRDVYCNKIDYPEGNMGEDLTISVQYLYLSRKIEYISEPLYNYYSNENSITKDKSKLALLDTLKNSVLNAEKVVDFFKHNGLFNEYKYEIEFLLFNKKNLLKPLLADTECFQLWRNTFPQINHVIQFNPLLSIKSKVLFLLRYYRILK